MNIAEADLRTFVDPGDAALVLGFRALEAGDPFEKSFPVWMATLRRHSEDAAIIDSVQRVFTQLADEASLDRLLGDLYRHAHSIGYRRLWFAPGLFREPLFVLALKKIAEAVKRPIAVVPATGMAGIELARGF